MFNNSISLKNKSWEWISIKICFIIAAYLSFKTSLYQVDFINVNKGICMLANGFCAFLIDAKVKMLIRMSFIVLGVFYILEKQMKIVLFLLFMLTLYVFSAHESYGVQSRTGIIPLVFLAQFIAYLKLPVFKNAILEKTRIFYSIQVIAASYTLSALSKLKTSGFSWFIDSKYMVLQMLKSNQMKYFDGVIEESELMDYKMNWVLEYPVFFSIMLLAALLIELTCALALINNKTKILYGILLLAMHIGIAFLFKIVIFSFVSLVLIFFLNPLYLVSKLFIKKPFSI